jgi:hypothetical protein
MMPYICYLNFNVYDLPGSYNENIKTHYRGLSKEDHTALFNVV